MLSQLTKNEYENIRMILDIYALKTNKHRQLRAEHRKKSLTTAVPCPTFNCDRCYILFPCHKVHKVHVDYCAYSYYSLRGLMKRMKKLLDYTVERGFVQKSEHFSKRKGGKSVERSSFKVTQADIKAHRLLYRAGFVGVLTNSSYEIIKAGNRIIELAEQIKAERSAVAMEGE